MVFFAKLKHKKEIAFQSQHKTKVDPILYAFDLKFLVIYKTSLG